MIQIILWISEIYYSNHCVGERYSQISEKTLAASVKLKKILSMRGKIYKKLCGSVFNRKHCHTKFVINTAKERAVFC